MGLVAQDFETKWTQAASDARGNWRSALAPGALLLKIRQKYGNGLRTAYYRDRIRPRILNTAPVPDTHDRTCEIHVLTCAEDWLNLLWTLKSFYLSSRRGYALCIHEDGSLRAEHVSHIRAHFPSARFLCRHEADRLVEKSLAAFPRSLAFRRSNPLALKVFDFATFLEGDRMLLLDSDILFFAEPTELLRRIERQDYRKNSLNKDWSLGYPVEPSVWEGRHEFTLPRLINSGLGLIHRNSIRLDSIEGFLALPGIFDHSHRTEQTLIALCSAVHGFEFLPEEYDVRVTDGHPTLPCRHYVGPIRHLMYREGMRYLVRRGVLNE